MDEADTASIISFRCRRCNSPCCDAVSPVTEMPGSKSKKKVNKRKGGAGTAAGSAKVPRVEDGEINTLGAIEGTGRSTRISHSGEGKSNNFIIDIIVLSLSSDLALLIHIVPVGANLENTGIDDSMTKGSIGDGTNGEYLDLC